MTIDLIKEHLTKEEIIEWFDLETDYRGFLDCPKEDHKKQTVKFEDNHWYCFECEASGSIIDYVGFKLNKPFKDTLTEIEERLGILTTSITVNNRKQRESDFLYNINKKFQESKRQILQHTFAHYQTHLKRYIEVIEKLDEIDSEAIDKDVLEAKENLKYLQKKTEEIMKEIKNGQIY